MEAVIGARFILGKKIGNGAFGTIFEGVEKKTKRKVAIKLEIAKNGRLCNLEHEYQILQHLQGEEGIPQVFWFGKESNHYVLVMELLERNLETVFSQEAQRKNFSLMTIVLVIDQMLSRLQQIHSRGVIHRDIKPENFVFKPISPQNKKPLKKSVADKERDEISDYPKQMIFLLDFGLGNFYINPATGKHISERKKTTFVGTVGFSSLNSHLLKEQSRRDDLEGLAYIMIYLMTGKLPWHGFPPHKDRVYRYNQIVKKKFETKPEDLITSDMPAEFFLFYQYCRELSFYQTPDYGYLHRLLRDVVYAESFNYAITFQWLTEKQMHSYSPFKTTGSMTDRNGGIRRSAFRIQTSGMRGDPLRTQNQPLDSNRSSLGHGGKLGDSFDLHHLQQMQYVQLIALLKEEQQVPGGHHLAANEMDYEMLEREHVANAVAQEFLGFNKAVLNDQDDNDGFGAHHLDDQVSPQTKRILRRLSDEPAGNIDYESGEGGGSRLKLNLMSDLKAEVSQFEEDDKTPLLIPESERKLSGGGTSQMRREESVEQCQISELPQNVAESLARHGFINLAEDLEEQPLLRLKTPSKQQQNLIQMGILHAAAIGGGGRETQAITTNPLATLSPNPLKVLKHFVKPERLQDASSMLASNQIQSKQLSSNNYVNNNNSIGQ